MYGFLIPKILVEMLTLLDRDFFCVSLSDKKGKNVSKSCLPFISISPKVSIGKYQDHLACTCLTENHTRPERGFILEISAKLGRKRLTSSMNEIWVPSISSASSLLSLFSSITICFFFLLNGLTIVSSSNPY